jgi:hypothetical protein
MGRRDKLTALTPRGSAIVSQWEAEMNAMAQEIKGIEVQCKTLCRSREFFKLLLYCTEHISENCIPKTLL